MNVTKEAVTEKLVKICYDLPVAGDEDILDLGRGSQQRRKTSLQIHACVSTQHPLCPALIQFKLLRSPEESFPGFDSSYNTATVLLLVSPFPVMPYPVGVLDKLLQQRRKTGTNVANTTYVLLLFYWAQNKSL